MDWMPPIKNNRFKNFKQGNRKQYGLKHRVTGSIHSAMGDTLSHMATEISSTQKKFHYGTKGNLVLLSRTKFAQNTIFIGNKTDTLNAHSYEKNAWSEYMELVLDIITLTSSETNEGIL